VLIKIEKDELQRVKVLLNTAEREIHHAAKAKNAFKRLTWDRQLVPDEFSGILLYAALKRKYETLRNKKVLQLACNHGLFLDLLRHNEHCEVYGIDLDTEATEFAREQCNLNVVDGDLNKEKISKILKRNELPQKMDIIISINFLMHHYRAYYDVILSNCRDVLAKGGLVFNSREHITCKDYMDKIALTAKLYETNCYVYPSPFIVWEWSKTPVQS